MLLVGWWLRGLGVGRVVVVGCGFGGWVAAELVTNRFIPDNASPRGLLNDEMSEAFAQIIDETTASFVASGSGLSPAANSGLPAGTI